MPGINVTRLWTATWGTPLAPGASAIQAYHIMLDKKALGKIDSSIGHHPLPPLFGGHGVPNDTCRKGQVPCSKK